VTPAGRSDIHRVVEEKLPLRDSSIPDALPRPRMRTKKTGPIRFLRQRFLRQRWRRRVAMIR
jgi:hypothetical protein